jgi:periplasmic mercuric ion binding protein
MKNSLKSVLVVAVLLVMSSFYIDSNKTVSIVIRTKIYCDHCKVCESCEPRIVTAVEEVKGVVSATLDVPKEELTVWYKPEKTNPENIRKAIINCGFAADDLAPDPAAYDRLDECCKKQH